MHWDRKKSPVLFFIFTSVLLHLLLLFIFRETFLHLVSHTKPEEPPVWVSLQQPQELPIADIPKPAEERIPEKASAQALYNQAVPEETVRPTPLEPPQNPGADKAAKGKTSAPQLQEKPLPSSKLPDLYAKQHETEDHQELQKGGSPSEDYLPSYKVGNRTYINTDANPHIGYFVELKRKFKLTWNPIPVVRGYAGQLSQGNIGVVLGVSVDGNGNLADLVIIHSSGLDGYDTEAKRTITSSAPFSSPPAQLVGPDGLVHMAWTFTVYL